MKYVNGFFQLDIRSNGVYAHIFPERDGGRKIMVQEFAEYLERCGIRDYNLSELNKAIAQATKETDLFVSPTIIPEVDEMINIRVTEDRMMVVVRFYPPSRNGRNMTEQEIMEQLENARITYGISLKIIKAYVSGRQFCRDIPIAKGKAVVPEKSAQVIYKFETNPTAKPKLLEDGSVDFHELNMFTSVKKGDLLAELIPEEEGEPGIDVYGNVVQPAKPRKGVLKYGRNIQLSEDKLRIYSEVNGDVKLEGDTVFVSNTYTVPADVDNSTGDIRYEGNVYVTGNVRAGFRVEASGDIEVNGVVEGATLIAGGSIVLKRGVQGMSKGYLQAGGDIVTKFLESTNVKAGHVINTGSSLHSNLEAGESIVVSGKKGFLIGGTVTARKKIEASVFGNRMNTVTTLKVGSDPDSMGRFRELGATIKEKRKELSEHYQVLETLKKKMVEGKKLTPNQLISAKQAGDSIKAINVELDKYSSEYALLKKEVEESRGGKIVANHTIYPGVCIYISNMVYPVKDVRSRCQFRLNGGDVESMPI